MDIERYLKQIFWDADVYVTAVENDGREEVVCGACQKSISDPAFKHRYSDLFFHIPCLNEPTHYKAFMLHFENGHDRLIFTEELRTYGMEEVVCFGCDKPAVLGPGYKCSTSKCKFLLHQSCAKLCSKMQHPFHPNHTLFLVGPKRKSCNACGKNCNRYPFYCCSKCDFNLDIACATHSPINDTGNCQHTFISFFKQIQFTCQACGDEGKEFASLCGICQLLIHGKCAQFSRIIKIAGHHHSLTLTYSLLQVEEHLDNNIICGLCSKKVKTKYGAYYCQECSYVAHLVCAFEDKKSSNPKSLSEEFKPEVIRHFSHQHNLELRDDKLCDGCSTLISPPFYSCTQCNFFIHSRCAQPLRKTQHPLHQHQLTLIPQAPYFGRVFSCDACERLSNGFAYRCDMCDFNIDLQCYSISETLKHAGHQHSLFLAINFDRICRVCNCTSNKKPGIFVCTSCDFALGLECATLPLTARHRCDDHLLELTYTAKDPCEEYYCLICEKEMDPNHWFYYCIVCDFPAHRHCVLGKYPYIKFGSTFISEDVHRHPLTFVPKTESSPPCDACGENFDGLALECTQCNFNVHYHVSCVRKRTKPLHNDDWRKPTK